jgi:hypothetical protein
MTDTTPIFGCNRCGREAEAIFACPERSAGNCAFVEQRGSSKPRTAQAVPFIIIGFVVLYVLLLFTNWDLLVLGLVSAVIGLALWRLSRDVQLYDSRSGLKLQRTTWAGFGLTYTWITTGRLLPIQLKPSRPLTYPLSIAALAAHSGSLGSIQTKQAANILRAALIGLLAEQCLHVYRVQSYVFRKWQRSPALVAHHVVAAACAQGHGIGALEDAILAALTARPATAPAKASRTDDRSIYDLVMAIDSVGGASYSGWLVGRVAGDALSRGIGELQGQWFWKRIKVPPAQAEAVANQHKTTQALSERLEQLYPAFSRELDKHVLKAIVAREPSAD